MMEPDFDDEDLIEDYIEDSSEPPPGYDEYLEEMMEENGEQSGETAAGASSGATQTQANTTTSTDNSTSNRNSEQNGASDMIDSMMQQEEEYEEEDDDDDERAERSAKVTQAYAKTREGKKNLYTFERYNQNTDWRREAGGSSPKNTMKAKEWKVTASREDALSTAGLTKHRSAATAPDSQLLEFLASRTRRPPKIALPRHCVHRNPVEGETSVPMTLGDGTRIHVRVRKESESSTKSSITSQHQRHVNVLGTPIAELMRRVQAIRRKEEHERQQRTSRELREAINEDDDDSVAESVEAKEGQPIDDKLWVDKHAPSSFAHLLSDERTNREVVRALRAWDPYVFQRDPPVRPDTGFRPDANKGGAPNDKEDSVPPPKASKDRRPDETTRVILLSGPPGVGKTTLAHIIAQHAGYRPLEVNGSDERSASVLTERVVRAMESTTLNVALMQGGGAGSKPKPNCLILDEIDGAESKDAVQSLVDIIRAEIPPKGAKGKKTTYLRRPIIFICNNKYAPVLRPLLPFARHFNVFPPSPSRLVARLRSVLTTEKMSVFGGSSLLHQLVATSCGDIRSCLYTLQFASSRAREVAKLNRRRGEAGEALRDSLLVDISPSLKSALDGDGMKDQRNDVAGTITSIFRKQKEKRFGDLFGATKDRRSSAVRVLDSVQSFGDNSRLLDCLFMNVLRVSYIDPTFDRCSAAHEWLSSSDIYRSHNTSVASNNGAAKYAMEGLHIPSAAAAVHFLCRVEQRPDLTFSTRDMVDVQYQQEANYALTQKFVEGLSPQAGGSRCVNLLATETIPYALWVLSAGEGGGSLNRAASSLDILTKGERLSLDMHVATLRSLGLTYVAADEEHRKEYGAPSLAMNIRLEPPIERFVQFTDLSMSRQQKRQEIPPAMKELLAHRAAHDKMRHRELEATEQNTRQDIREGASKMDKPSLNFPRGVKDTSGMPDLPNKRSVQAGDSSSLPPAKRPKASTTAQNFLGIGAKKAKEARSARTAARVGVERADKKNKTAHTGSGVPFPQVIRLKYVKGFTQAVRTPCRLDDLA